MENMSCMCWTEWFPHEDKSLRTQYESGISWITQLAYASFLHRLWVQIGTTGHKLMVCATSRSIV